MRIHHSGVHSLWAMILVLAPEVFANPSDTPAVSVAIHPDHVASELLVGFKSSASPEQIRELEIEYKLTRKQVIDHLNVILYGLPEDISVEGAIKALAKHPFLQFAEPNYRRRISTSTDPHFNDQWSLHNTGQTVNGIRSTAGIDIDWPEADEILDARAIVGVAVIDTGVAIDHPEFLDLETGDFRSLANFQEGDGVQSIDDDSNGYVDDVIGWDFVDDDNVPLDENGHGTLVASIISGLGDNGELGTGVAPLAFMLPIRLFDDFGSASDVADICAATTYAESRGVRIINCSFGGFPFSSTELAQIEWLRDREVLLVCAAGNGGEDRIGDDNDQLPQYPSSYDVANIISVAAIDQAGELSTFSNFGLQSVDIAAPGVNIFGADIDREVIFFEDFESGASGWTTGALPGNESTFDWSLFSETLFTNTWLTDSDSGFFGLFSDYEPNTDTYVKSPLIDLAGVFGPQLTFCTKFELERAYDWLFVEVTADGFSWDVVARLTGSSELFEEGYSDGVLFAADLSPYEGELIEIRFRIITDSRIQEDGVFIDDITITRVKVFEYDGSQFQFLTGTSFAAPIVSGVAALIWSQRPDLSLPDVRQILLETATELESLDGKVASHGLVNAKGALDAANGFPISVPAFHLTAEPTDEEQMVLELINRSRADALTEAQRYLQIVDDQSDPHIVSGVEFYNVDVGELERQFGELQRHTQPLSMNAALLEAARRHTTDMFGNTFQGHTGTDGTNSSQRIAQSGYGSASSTAENVFAFARSVTELHAAFDIDWGTGNSGSIGGMQNPPDHRKSIHNPAFREAGIGITAGTNEGIDPFTGQHTTVGPVLGVETFAVRVDAESLVTGVAYFDLNEDGFYDIGEGLGGIRVDVDGADFYAITSQSGGYAVPLPANGWYTVRFSGSNLDEVQDLAVITDALNYKLDFLLSYSDVPPEFDGTAVANSSNVVTLEPVPGATGYVVRQTRLVNAHQAEGAEDEGVNFTFSGFPESSFISAGTFSAGQHSFHLLNPDFADQSLTLNRVFVPSSASDIRFFSRLAAATEQQTARLQISNDDGQEWTDLWSQSGTGFPGEVSFTEQIVPLGEFAGRPVILRFLFEFGSGSAFTQVGDQFGFFFDDIAVTEAQEAAEISEFELAASLSFDFFPPSIGTYMIEIAARNLDRVLPFGNPLTVDVQISASELAELVLIRTNLGVLPVKLFSRKAPRTVANFRCYIDDGDYSDTIIHRSVAGFVIQGGGFSVSGAGIEWELLNVSEEPPILNEFGTPNTRGTIAMAKLGGDPNSATSQWFINLADNSANLDNQNGGFTVFGEVIGNGMEVVDAIAAIPVFDAGGALNSLPLSGFDGGPINIDNLVIVEGVDIQETPVQPNRLIINGPYEYLLLRSEPGKDYQLQTSTDLANLTWSNFGSLNSGTGNLLSWPIDLDEISRFFRAAVQDTQ